MTWGAVRSMRSAIQIAASICASAQAYREGRIGHARMAERIRADWQEAERTRRVAEVKRALAEAYGVDLLGRPLRRVRVAFQVFQAGGGAKVRRARAR